MVFVWIKQNRYRGLITELYKVMLVWTEPGWLSPPPPSLCVKLKPESDYRSFSLFGFLLLNSLKRENQVSFMPNNHNSPSRRPVQIYCVQPCIQRKQGASCPFCETADCLHACCYSVTVDCRMLRIEWCSLLGNDNNWNIVYNL